MADSVPKRLAAVLPIKRRRLIRFFIDPSAEDSLLNVGGAVPAATVVGLITQEYRRAPPPFSSIVTHCFSLSLSSPLDEPISDLHATTIYWLAFDASNGDVAHTSPFLLCAMDSLRLLSGLAYF